jgi:hypothetical protein
MKIEMENTKMYLEKNCVLTELNWLWYGQIAG